MYLLCVLVSNKTNGNLRMEIYILLTHPTLFSEGALLTLVSLWAGVVLCVHSPCVFSNISHKCQYSGQNNQFVLLLWTLHLDNGGDRVNYIISLKCLSVLYRFAIRILTESHSPISYISFYMI